VPASWTRRGVVAIAIVVAGLPVHTSPRQNTPPSVRRPRGIYAVVAEARAAGENVDLNALVNNSAVSGLAMRVFWSELQPAKDKYDFSQLDAAFAAAAAKHKTIQLILVPGFGTPSWVLDEITMCETSETGSGSAGGGRRAARGETRGETRRGGTRGGAAETTTGAAPANCGKAMFEVSEGRANGQQQPLPLPWNPTYKSYWKAFLTAVAARYGSNEAFVSIAVAGPTAESVEIILPRSGNQLERWAELLQGAYHDASYHRTDKAFVEEWDAAVTMYGEVFRNVTLVVTRGSGLLNFTKGQNDEAQAAIVNAFARHKVGSNLKATQTSGMKACRETNGGIKGVKEMASDSAFSPRVLGGAQFDTSFSKKPANEGCTASCEAASAECQGISPKDALVNVLRVYFDGTPDGAAFGAPKGSTPMNYLQIYAPDITFAATQPAVQALLDQASQRLLAQAR
jgi:hypothetical protein